MVFFHLRRSGDYVLFLVITNINGNGLNLLNLGTRFEEVTKNVLWITPPAEIYWKSFWLSYLKDDVDVTNGGHRK